MSLRSAFSGIFPLVSFLHVPRQMPQPKWLALGTAFCVHPSVLTESLRSRYPVILLTAAHTFVPWNFLKLGLPEDFCKARYIVVRLYAYDDLGAARPDVYVDARLVATHPVADLAAISVKDLGTWESFLSKHNDASSTPGCENVLNHSLVVPDGVTQATMMGFRGRGVLGDAENVDLERLKALPADERHALQAKYVHAVGQQDAFSTTVTFPSPAEKASLPSAAFTSSRLDTTPPSQPPATSITAVGKVDTLRGLAGMSGSPLLKRDGGCLGILTHGSKVPGSYVNYVPSAVALDWVRGVS